MCILSVKLSGYYSTHDMHITEYPVSNNVDLEVILFYFPCEKSR